MNPTIVVLTGPSCSGKSTLEGMLKAGRGYTSITSTTTRAMRPGEVNGQHYHFVSDDTFARMEKEGAFIETAPPFPGGRYGGTAAEFERATADGKPAVIVVEPHGARQIAQYCDEHDWNLVRVCVDAPAQMLMQRWLERYQKEMQGTTDPVKLDKITQGYAKRMANYVENQSKWRINHTYDIIVDEFNPDTQDAVIAQIERMVTHHMRREDDTEDETVSSVPSV